MRVATALLLGALGWGVATTTSCLAGTPAPVSYEPDIATWVTTSSKSHRAYQVWVALPAGYNRTHAPYPVLYAMDANAEFSSVVGAARLLAFDGTIPQLIVVGIGYPRGGQGFQASFADRTVDLSPPGTAESLALVRGTAEAFHVPSPQATGGADAFLDFVRAELVPVIEQKYAASSSDRAFVGHSLAGLFGLHVLFHNEGLFQRFLIGSPSLWWNDGEMFRTEAQYSSRHQSLPVRLFLSVGGNEEADLGAMHMVSNVNRFAAQLAAHHYQDLQIEKRVFEGDSHGSVIPAMLSSGLRSLYPR